MTIDLATARTHLKADGDDDALISRYLLGARSICESFCNRRFYDTQEESDADFLAAISDLQEAEIARDAMLDSALTPAVHWATRDRFIGVIGAIKQRVNGIVINDLIEAAILKMTGELYFGRQDSAAVPTAVQRILQPYLWIGDLADSDEGGS